MDIILIILCIIFIILIAIYINKIELPLSNNNTYSGGADSSGLVSTMEDNKKYSETIKLLSEVYTKFYHLTVMKNKIVNYFTDIFVMKYGSKFLFKFREFFNDIFMKWIFDLNIRNKLNEAIPEKFDNEINIDIQYLAKQYGSPIDWKLEIINNYLKEMKNGNNIIVNSFNIKAGKQVYIELNTSVGKFISLAIMNKQYQHLIKKYIGKHFEVDFIHLLLLYTWLGAITQHLSAPPKFMDNYGFTHELFGTPLNTWLNFCSPFYYIDKQFGSSGSFFDYELKSNNVYSGGPPYDNDLMTKMAKKYLHDLQNPSINNVVIFITLPLWDSKSQKQLGLKDYNMNFEALDILLENPYLYGHAALKRNEFKFYNYFTDEYHGIAPVHFIVLAKNPAKPLSDMNQIIYDWNQACF